MIGLYLESFGKPLLAQLWAHLLTLRLAGGLDEVHRATVPKLEREGLATRCHPPGGETLWRQSTQG